MRARVNIVARAERLEDEELSSTHRPAMRLLDISMGRHGHAARLHRKRGCAAAVGCSSAIALALWWLVRAGVARVGLVGVPCPCGAGRTFGEFGALEAWQTAALNAYKRPL